MGDNSNLQTHRCAQRPDGFGIRNIGTGQFKGWYLMRFGYDYNWSECVYLPITKIDWCPFCGEKLGVEE